MNRGQGSDGYRRVLELSQLMWGIQSPSHSPRNPARKMVQVLYIGDAHTATTSWRLSGPARAVKCGKGGGERTLESAEQLVWSANMVPRQSLPPISSSRGHTLGPARPLTG